MNTIGCGRMKNQKGFVFVETLIVVAILTASLLMLYSTYSAIIRKEKTRVKYNDSVYLYRTYYFEKFFHNFRLDILMGNLNKDDSSKPISLLTGFGCTHNLFINEEDNLGLCEILKEELHVSKFYLTFNDLSALQNCKDKTSGMCETLLQVNDTMASYLKTIGGSGSSGYRIILEFSENKDGSQCSGEACQFYYATLSLGDLL